MTRPDPDRTQRQDNDARALRTATWRLAAITAAAVTIALVVVGALVLAVVVRDQHAMTSSTLRQAVSDTDDVANSPSDIAVWVRDDEGEIRTSRSAPAWMPVEAGVAAVSTERTRDDREVTEDGETYKVRTVLRKEGEIVQAAYATADERAERDRVVQAILIAELVGLVLSLGLGLLLARRAIRPLAIALDRQRRFVADASHELRTPLTLMSTRAQLLERRLRAGPDAVDGEDAHEQADALVADTRRMSDVVDDLVLSASLGAEAARREPVDLRSMAREAVAAATAHAADLGVSLVGPDEGAGVVVDGAPGPLRRVTDALIDNAVSHTPPDGVVTVEVIDGSTAQIRVTDTGPGIDPEIAPHLFHRFAHGSRPGRTGFGLGLSLVQEIVEAHGGEVAATNASTGGACFVVRLPRSQR